jgi:hypothetical protein
MTETEGENREKGNLPHMRQEKCAQGDALPGMPLRHFGQSADWNDAEVAVGPTEQQEEAGAAEVNRRDISIHMREAKMEKNSRRDLKDADESDQNESQENKMTDEATQAREKFLEEVQKLGFPVQVFGRRDWEGRVKDEEGEGCPRNTKNQDEDKGGKDVKGRQNNTR